MIKPIVKTSSAALLLLAATMAHAHFIDVEGDVEVEGDGYVKTGDGLAVSSSSGCVNTSKLSDDNKIAACAGEEEPVVEEPKAEPEPTKEPEPVAQEPVTKTLRLDGSALFATNSDQLSGDGEAAMLELVDKLKGFQEISSIDITGHTDNRGSVEYNQDLSERRAATVASYVAAAFPDAPINSSGAGELSPIASNQTAEGRQQNRRVEVTVSAVSVK